MAGFVAPAATLAVYFGPNNAPERSNQARYLALRQS
jgi:hypothetical protein